MKRIVSLAIALLLIAPPAYPATNTFPASGNAGIGTTSPNTALTITQNSSGAPAINRATSAVQIALPNATAGGVELDTFGGYPIIDCYRSDGTLASQTAVQANDILCDYAAHGYNGSALSGTQAALLMYAGGNWSTTSEPTYITFGTTPIGSTTRAEALRIDTTGYVGIGTTAPGNPLSVNGVVESQTGGFKFPDGTTQTTAFVPGGSARTRLTANQTFYLSTTGSDSNSCLTSGAACATPNHVWNLIAENYDLAGYTATIQLADGTYTSGLDATLPILSGPVIINGDSTTPSNVVISTTGVDAVQAFGAGITFTIQNLEMTTSGTGQADLAALQSSTIVMGSGLVFGSVNASSGSQINAQGNSSIFILASYSIVGGGGFHYYVDDGSLIRVIGTPTVTLTGTPAFGQEFASSVHASQVDLSGITYSGSATGPRYAATLNGVIDTGTGNTSYFPGNAAGSTATGGQYN